MKKALCSTPSVLPLVLASGTQVHKARYRFPVPTGTRAQHLSPGHSVPSQLRRHAGSSAQAGLASASKEERGIKRDAGQGDSYTSHSHTSHASPLAAIGIACQRLGPVSGGAVNVVDE